ncbi:MAG: hypothetical protein DRP30_03435 [Thermotoga sp.]|nr:MAG: hypothetical protein DRP30_03435 [Thermotoga sp.]
MTYDIYFGRSPYNLKKRASQRTNRYDPGELEYDTTYYWKVVARDGKGGETEGPIWSFRTERKPNRAPNKPKSPDPYDGKTNVSIYTTLEWECEDPDGDELEYDIYIGKSVWDMKLVKRGHTTTRYDPGVLEYDTTYYWKIVAKDGRGGKTEGPIWSFRTEKKSNRAPEEPKALNPYDGAKDVSVYTVLSWICDDPDGDELEYDIYIGKSRWDMKLVKRGRTTTTYDPGELEYDTTYYWKVVAKDGRGGKTEGPVWRFTTEKKPNRAPNEPWAPNPYDGAKDVSIYPTLNWKCEDPDGDELEYDIYMGKSKWSMKLVESGVKSSIFFGNVYFLPEKLEYDTTYYWKVVARDGRGGETEGPIWSFKTEEMKKIKRSKLVILVDTSHGNAKFAGGTLLKSYKGYKKTFDWMEKELNCEVIYGSIKNLNSSKYDLLLIADPQSGYITSERNKIREFVKSGGNLMLIAKFRSYLKINQILYSLVKYDIFLGLDRNVVRIIVPKNNAHNFSSKVIGYQVGKGKLVVVSDFDIFSNLRNTELLGKIISWLRE